MKRRFLGVMAEQDTTAPTVTITSSESSPSFINPIPLTFTFSEIVTGFVVGDITVSAGGSIGNFAGSGTTYTADLTVTSAGATITVDVAGGVCQDGAGNLNTAATQFSITSNLRFLDNFTTAQAAPMTTPRNAEPGPGVLNLTDTSNKLSIVSTELLLPSMTTANTDPRIFTSVTHARSTGRALYFSFQQLADTVYFYGWRSSDTALPNSFAISKQGVWSIRGASLNANTPYTPADATQYRMVLLNNSIGGLVVVKGGAFTEWTLLYPFKDATYAAMANVYAGIGGGASANVKTDTMKIVDLPAPFTTDYGPATNRVAVPGVDEVTTQIANAIVEMTWTAVTGETFELSVRRTDDNNRWIIRGSQAGSTVKLIQMEAGVETERATAAQTWTNGTNYRVVVIMNGNNIWAYVADTLKNTYTSASFNNTATGVKTNKAGANLVAWPLVLSSSSLTVFTNAFP
jgi:hypothetical protein